MNYQEWYNKYVDKEEGIIDNLFNKNQKVQYKDITKQKTNIINQAFKNDNIKNIALNTDIKSIRIGGNKAYHRSGNIVLKANYDDIKTLSHGFFQAKQKTVETPHYNKKTLILYLQTILSVYLLRHQ